jgi:site-specific DNA-methyltransferase (adenine-specific)
MYTGKYYYNQEHFKLIKGNTFRALKKFNDKTVDIIFADPPYFLSNDGITCSRWKDGNSK